MSGKVSSKPDLYIIHGWTYTVEPWNKTLALLAEAGLNVKMLHVPGLTEPSDKVFTMDDYVKWADAAIPDGAIALGHSNGGRILLNLCVRKPEKLKFLILLDSAGVYEPSARKEIVGKLAKIGRPLKKIPGVDMISFGPDMKDIHTPQECLCISSVQRVWEYVVEVLRRMK